MKEEILNKKDFCLFRGNKVYQLAKERYINKYGLNKWLRYSKTFGIIANNMCNEIDEYGIEAFMETK